MNRRSFIGRLAVAVASVGASTASANKQSTTITGEDVVNSFLEIEEQVNNLPRSEINGRIVDEILEYVTSREITNEQAKNLREFSVTLEATVFMRLFGEMSNGSMNNIIRWHGGTNVKATNATDRFVSLRDGRPFPLVICGMIETLHPTP